MNVVKDPDNSGSGKNIPTTVTADQMSSAESQIKNDYSNQVKDIDSSVKSANNATVDSYNKHNATLESQVNNYNKALADYNTQKAEYDKQTEAYNAALSKYQSDEAAYQKKLAQYQNDETAYQKAEATYQQQLADYNKQKAAYDEAEKQYQSALVDYNKNLANWENTVRKQYSQNGQSIEGYNTSAMEQKLQMANNPDASVSYSIAPGMEIIDTNNNDTSFRQYIDNLNTQADSKDMYQVQTTDGSAFGNRHVADFTFSNLQNMEYNNAPISTIKLSIDGVQGSNINAVMVMQDPMEGIWYQDVPNSGDYVQEYDGVDLTYTFFDKDGKQITFGDGSDGEPNAFISVGSLNNSIESGTVDDPKIQTVEGVTLESAGHALTLAGSTVTAHEGNNLYANNCNDPGVGNSLPTWDVGADSPYEKNRYMGAGVLQISGNEVKLRPHMQVMFNGDSYSPIQPWFTFSTDRKSVV